MKKINKRNYSIRSSDSKEKTRGVGDMKPCHVAYRKCPICSEMLHIGGKATERTRISSVFSDRNKFMIISLLCWEKSSQDV